MRNLDVSRPAQPICCAHMYTCCVPYDDFFASTSLSTARFSQAHREDDSTRPFDRMKNLHNIKRCPSRVSCSPGTARLPPLRACPFSPPTTKKPELDLLPFTLSHYAPFKMVLGTTACQPSSWLHFDEHFVEELRQKKLHVEDRKHVVIQGAVRR